MELNNEFRPFSVSSKFELYLNFLMLSVDLLVIYDISMMSVSFTLGGGRPVNIES